MKYYADIMPDGRVRACLKYDHPDEGPPTPDWETQAEGRILLIDGPISWAGPFPEAALFYDDTRGFYWRDDRELIAAVEYVVGEIDRVADAARLLQCPPGREAEYTRAEQQAREYRDAGYVGSAGEMVTDWAAAKGWSAHAAADDILAAAARAEAQLVGIRRLRLAAKEQARKAVDNDAAGLILSEFCTSLAALTATNPL